MDMEGALAVARLIAELDGVDGRTRLQKLVYLLKSKAHHEFKQHFILHYFGPFSHQLAAQLNFLCAAALVKEQRDDVTGSFSYRVTDEETKEQINSLRHGADEPPAWADFAKQLDGDSTELLEAVATLVYLRNRGLHGATLETEFRRIKPHLKGRFTEAKTFAKQNSLG